MFLRTEMTIWQHHPQASPQATFLPAAELLKISGLWKLNRFLPNIIALPAVLSYKQFISDITGISPTWPSACFSLPKGKKLSVCQGVLCSVQWRTLVPYLSRSKYKITISWYCRCLTGSFKTNWEDHGGRIEWSGQPRMWDSVPRAKHAHAPRNSLSLHNRVGTRLAITSYKDKLGFMIRITHISKQDKLDGLKREESTAVNMALLRSIISLYMQTDTYTWGAEKSREGKRGQERHRGLKNRRKCHLRKKNMS